MTKGQAKGKADELTRGKIVAQVGSYCTNGVVRHVINVTHAEDMENRPRAYTLSET